MWEPNILKEECIFFFQLFKSIMNNAILYFQYEFSLSLTPSLTVYYIFIIVHFN